MRGYSRHVLAPEQHGNSGLKRVSVLTEQKKKGSTGVLPSACTLPQVLRRTSIYCNAPQPTQVALVVVAVVLLPELASQRTTASSIEQNWRTPVWL